MYIKKSNHITATSQQKPIDFEYTSSGHIKHVHTENSPKNVI